MALIYTLVNGVKVVFVAATATINELLTLVTCGVVYRRSVENTLKGLLQGLGSKCLKINLVILHLLEHTAHASKELARLDTS